MPSYRFHRHPQTAAVVAASAAPAANVETKACRSEDPNQAVVDAVWLVGILAIGGRHLGIPVCGKAVAADASVDDERYAGGASDAFAAASCAAAAAALVADETAAATAKVPALSLVTDNQHAAAVPDLVLGLSHASVVAASFYQTCSEP